MSHISFVYISDVRILFKHYVTVLPKKTSPIYDFLFVCFYFQEYANKLTELDL